MGRKQGPVERVLRKARGLIAVGWTRGAYHVRRRGVDCYCVAGALNAADPSGPDGAAIQIVWSEAREAGYGGPVDFNDKQRTKKPVLALFDRAIATAKERGL